MVMMELQKLEENTFVPSVPPPPPSPPSSTAAPAAATSPGGPLLMLPARAPFESDAPTTPTIHAALASGV